MPKRRGIAIAGLIERHNYFLEGKTMQEFSKSFDGTVVNLKIKMGDTQNYETVDEQIGELFF